MVTFSTWGLVGFILLIMVAYTVTLVIASKFIGKGMAAKMLYLVPVYPLDTAKRTYAIARQLGVPETDITYTGKSITTGKSEYYIKSTDQVVTVESFFGIVVKTRAEEVLNSEYHAFSAESISQQHNYLAQLKEQGLEPDLATTEEGESDVLREVVQEVEGEQGGETTEEAVTVKED